MVIIMFCYFNLDSTLVGSNFEPSEEAIVGETPLIWSVILPGKKSHLLTHKIVGKTSLHMVGALAITLEEKPPSLTHTRKGKSGPVL